MRLRPLGFFCVAFVVAACGGKIDDGTDAGVDGGTDSPAPPPPTCKPTGGACSVSVDCCLPDACIGGYCGTNPTCSPDYSKCASSTQCCSQLCDPQSGFCAPNGPPPPPSCEPDGAPCSSPSQCCSQVCAGNLCGGAPPPPPPCEPNGATCAFPGECCSNVCSNGTCGGGFVDAGPLDGGPVSCASTSSKLCDQCVASFCCAEMVSCSAEPLCDGWLNCVQGCEQKGNSASFCTQSVCGVPQDAAEKVLYSCAQQHCATQCAKD